MSNPITATVNWLLANPLASHAVVSGLETFALAEALQLAGVGHAPAVAAVLVSGFYYGREAGQREHDLKHMTPPVSGFMAFLGAEYGFKWGLDNLTQWLAAAGATSAVAAAMTFGTGAGDAVLRLAHAALGG